METPASDRLSEVAGHRDLGPASAATSNDSALMAHLTRPTEAVAADLAPSEGLARRDVDRMTSAAEALIERTRLAQGLPRWGEDPTVLARIAELVRDAARARRAA